MNISSIPMCYTICCNVNKFSLQDVAYVHEEYHIGNQWT